jgi:hypothetical protein
VRVSGTPFRDEAQLAEMERRIAETPDAINLLFARACCLEDIGRPDDARIAYTTVLERDPKHFGALTNLGSLYFERGEFVPSRSCFRLAAAHHPQEPMAHVNLAHQAAEDGDVALATTHYEIALGLKPGYFYAHHGLALLHERNHDPAGAERQFALAFAGLKPWTFPYRGTGEPLSILVLAAGRGGDVVTNPFFDDRKMLTTILIPEAHPAGTPLPPHHVIFNGIGEADRARSSLERAVAVVAESNAPVINDPARVLATGREAIAERLRRIPGVVTPRTALLARAAVTAPDRAARGFSFPCLLRSPGFHAGRHFVRAETAAALEAALAELPGDELFAIEQLDARGADGNARKYRVVFVDGEPYPVHLAISAHWKVHYFSADMAQTPAHRAEEAAFLTDMPSVVGPEPMRALAGIGEALGLDYGGVDFALDRAGNVLVFESNATMAVYLPNREERWAYRRAPAERIIAAVRAMLVAKARSAGYEPP